MFIPIRTHTHVRRCSDAVRYIAAAIVDWRVSLANGIDVVFAHAVINKCVDVLSVIADSHLPGSGAGSEA